jgi:hypothetical protein
LARPLSDSWLEELELVVLVPVPVFELLDPQAATATTEAIVTARVSVGRNRRI